MIVTSPAIGFWIALLQPARGVFSMISVVPGGAVTVPPPGKVAVQSEFGQLSGDVFVIANGSLSGSVPTSAATACNW